VKNNNVASQHLTMRQVRRMNREEGVSLRQFIRNSQKVFSELYRDRMSDKIRQLIYR
jgi:hypothetical protein